MLAKMKTTAISMFALLLGGCYPAYQVYIHNNTNKPLYFKTLPALESRAEKEAPLYDSILAVRVMTENGSSTYEIGPDRYFHIDSHAGKVPFPNEIPFASIVLISGSDTMLLDTKKKIFDHLKAQPNKKRTYAITFSK